MLGTLEATVLKLVRDGDKVVFQAPNGKYVTAFQDGSLQAQATKIDNWERFDEARSVTLVNILRF
jgi:SOS-response transcriptional repressor LexA